MFHKQVYILGRKRETYIKNAWRNILNNVYISVNNKLTLIYFYDII